VPPGLTSVVDVALRVDLFSVLAGGEASPRFGAV
jgi:hypothetical protein